MLHSSIAGVSLIVSTSFDLTSATVSYSTSLPQYLLAALDAILGDTETSKAIAAIVVLVRREFQNPETGVLGEQVGLADLLVGLVAFALLQRWCQHETAKELEDDGAEQLVWDVVIPGIDRETCMEGCLVSTGLADQHTTSEESFTRLYEDSSVSSENLFSRFEGSPERARTNANKTESSAEANPAVLFASEALVPRLARFSRFASASYGSSFLRFLGISAASTSINASLTDASNASHHHEHRSFSTHTSLPPSTILLSSFIDPNGTVNPHSETGPGFPLVYYVSIDHASNAVVLTCRGTLGFEDVLTDMACDYDELDWCERRYTVHKGMLASAKRLLRGTGGRIMAVIRATLEDFPEYGIIFCGHSLGGGVAAILGLLVSEPAVEGDASNSSFVTAGRRRNQTASLPPTSYHLPAGRPIHVYAYGPPAAFSPSLRHASRGLITTVINNQDVVPYLSLGTLWDAQAVALAFQSTNGGAKAEIRRRIWEGLTSGVKSRIYEDIHKTKSGDADQWPWATLKALRAGMGSEKLVPPGEVFVLETSKVASSSDGLQVMPEGAGGREAAMRLKLVYVRDVEMRFREIRFGKRMLADHSPGGYEVRLLALEKAVCA